MSLRRRNRRRKTIDRKSPFSFVTVSDEVYGHQLETNDPSDVARAILVRASFATRNFAIGEEFVVKLRATDCTDKDFNESAWLALVEASTEFSVVYIKSSHDIQNKLLESEYTLKRLK